jgi:prophage antirepressor-like protein
MSAYTFNAKTIRVVTIEGEPWFVAVDVCRVLGHGNPTMAMRSLAADEWAKFNLGSPNDVNVISESGLYRLALRARVRGNPEVQEFQDWVTRVVLPAIRKDGMYFVGEEKVRSA